jgi:hypothetical protein
MRSLRYLAAALAIFVTLSGGEALANLCQTDHLLCATTMPVDGYCVCRAHGTSEDGTVVIKAPPRDRINATVGGCGADPRSPGCH